MAQDDGYYDRIAPGYEELHGDEQRWKFSLMKEKFLSNFHGTALDVGCGTAPYAEMIDFPTIGIDPSAELLKRCPYIRKKRASAEDLPFRDAHFDLVFSLTAIQNFNDIKKGLSEIRRVGKKLFVLSYLKKSDKAEQIEKAIADIFEVKERFVEQKDILFLLGP